MISFKQLEAFLTSARLGNFVAAATRLKTTQSNVSKRIQELEWAVGSPVFERGPRSLTLTLKGKQLLPQAEEVLAAYNSFAEVAAPGSAFSGPFSIGSVSAIALSWLSTFIHRVRQEHPGIVLSFQVDTKPQLSRQLASGTVDLVLGPAPFEAGQFETIPLGAEEFVWVCHPSLAPKEDQITLTHLAKLPIIEHPSEDNETRRMFSDRGIRPNIVATCSNFLTRARFAVSALGVTHLPRYVIDNELANGRLVVISCDIQPPPIHYSAAFRRGEASPLPMRLGKIAAECCDFQLFLK